MVSAFNHRPSRAALRKLLAQLLLSGLFMSAVFAGVPRSQGIQPSPTIRAESNAATHTLAVNIPVSEKNNIPNTTVSPGSCLFALLALAMLGVSQPSARFLANGSKDSRSLRISPIICILDSILLIDLFASLLWLGKGVREAAQCVAAFRYCEQDTDHLQLPQSSPKPTSNGTDPPIRIWSIVHEAESNTWLRPLLAIPALWQFIKLCGMGGVPVETAIGAAYVQSWLLNEISIWMGSPSTVSAKHPEKPIVTPQISYPASVLETVTMLQTTPSTTQLVLLRLVQATQACSMPCWCLILWYRMSAPHAIFHVAKAWAQDVCLVISGTKLTCTMFTYCWWVIPVAFVGMVIEVVEPGHRLVTLRKYYIPGPAALYYFILAISLGLPFVAGVFFSVLPVSTGVYIPIPWIVTVPGPYGPPAQPPHHTSKNGHQRPSFLSSLL